MRLPPSKNLLRIHVFNITWFSLFSNIVFVSLIIGLSWFGRPSIATWRVAASRAQPGRSVCKRTTSFSIRRSRCSSTQIPEIAWQRKSTCTVYTQLFLHSASYLWDSHVVLKICGTFSLLYFSASFAHMIDFHAEEAAKGIYFMFCTLRMPPMKSIARYICD